MWWTAFKYLIAGAVLWFLAGLFLADAQDFAARSTPAKLIVLQVDTRRQTDGDRVYRPVFGLDTTARPRPEYAGNIWMYPKPHQAGDVVPGRYDRARGEMRSDRMLRKSIWSLRIAKAFSLLAVLQGVLILFGIPELLLPLRVRFGR